VTWATSVPILVFLGFSVVDLGHMYATDRRQTDRETDKRQASDVRQHHRLMPPGRGIICTYGHTLEADKNQTRIKKHTKVTTVWRYSVIIIVIIIIIIIIE